VPRRNRNAGYRPPGPQPLVGMRKRLGLLSDDTRSVHPSGNRESGRDLAPTNLSGGQQRDADAALGRPRQRSTATARTGGKPVNDRLPETRPPARTSRIHAPVIDLGDDVVYVAQGLVRVRRERLEQLR
jgi:hypothetical protein